MEHVSVLNCLSYCGWADIIVFNLFFNLHYECLCGGIKFEIYFMRSQILTHFRWSSKKFIWNLIFVFIVCIVIYSAFLLIYFFFYILYIFSRNCWMMQNLVVERCLTPLNLLTVCQERGSDGQKPANPLLIRSDVKENFCFCLFLRVLKKLFAGNYYSFRCSQIRHPLFTDCEQLTVFLLSSSRSTGWLEMYF